jgi:sialidase-1
MLNFTKIPDFRKIAIFEAATLGYDLVHVPALIRTAGGTLLAFCEGRQRSGGDWADIDLLQRCSHDGGKTWDNVRVLVRGKGGPASNATPIATRDGIVHLLYQRNYNCLSILRSGDDGATWSEPREITSVLESFKPEYDWKIFAPGPGHAIELSNGRLLAPVWLCDPAGPGVPGGDHRPSCAATIASDDGGLTWKRGDIVANTAAPILNPSECTVAELSGGRVMINIRSESTNHRRLTSISPDGLTRWSSPIFHEDLYEPVCMAGFLSVLEPGTRNPILLFTNPDSRHDPVEHNKALHFGSRENGVIKLSRDEGKTWPEARVIEAGPFGYSDLAFDPNGIVYCIYVTGRWGKPPHHHSDYVAFVRFHLDWIRLNLSRPVHR